MESDLAMGFVTFHLYKWGEWVEVSVDSRIPCNEAGEPIFARSKDPDEESRG